MKIGALTLAQKMNCNGEPTRDWLIASWHWGWSITWSWGLSWSPHAPWYPKKAYYLRLNDGFMAGIRIPVIGDFHLQAQAAMPFRRRSKG